VTRPRTLIAVVVGVIAVLYGWWILHYGVKWGEDIGRFSQWGDSLLAARFNVVEYLQQTRFVAYAVLYLAWIAVVAAAKFIAGSEWQVVVVALNWAAIVLIAWLVLTTVWRLTSSAVAVAVAGLFLANFETLTFVSFAGSDILFLALATIVLVLSIRVAERPSARTAIVGTAVLLLACFFRPAAPPLIVVWIVALLWPRLGTRARSWIVPAIAMLIVLAALLQAAWMQDTARWPFRFLRAWYAYLKADYDAGMIVCGRFETYVKRPVTYADYLAMIVRRWLYFFAITLRDYSKLHKIVNVAYFLPLYALAIAGVLRRSAASTLLLVAVLATSAFHGMQEVDYDYRYRLPALPPLIMLAAFGAADLTRRPATPP
jgi:hypothetical protein